MKQVIYHETLGVKTDYGYGYKVVESKDVPAYVKQGWFEKSLDVPTNIHRAAAEQEEINLGIEADYEDVSPEVDNSADPDPESLPAGQTAPEPVSSPEKKKRGPKAKK